jgi:transposase-like protein
MVNRKMRTEQEYKQLAKELINKLNIDCPRGHNSRKVNISDSFNYRCKDKICRLNFNILDKTPFKGSKLGIWEILRIYDCWINGLTIKSISFVLDLNMKTIIRCLNLLENEITEQYYDRLRPIGGKNIIV